MPIPLALSALAAAALAAGPGPRLDVSPGLWEVKMTSSTRLQGGAPPADTSKLSPEVRARVEAQRKRLESGTPTTRVSRSCVTQEQLEKEPFLDEMAKKEGCSRKVLDRTARHLRFTLHCGSKEAKFEMDGEWEITVKSRDAVAMRGEMRSSGGGRTGASRMDMTARRLGASCGDLKPGESRRVGDGA